MPAQEIEDFVVEQIRRIASDPDLAEQVFAEAVNQQKVQKRRLKAEQRKLQRERQQKCEEFERLVTAIGASKEPLASPTDRLRELEAMIERIDQRMTKIGEELTANSHKTIDEGDLTSASSLFDPVWDELYPAEEIQILNLLVERVGYDAGVGQLQIIPGVPALEYLPHPGGDAGI